MAGFLSEREREELRMAHRCESQVRYADRIKAVLLLDAGWHVSKIVEALLLDGNTIRRHKELYLAEGIDGLCNDNYHGRVCALTQRDQKELCKALRTKIYLSTVEIVRYVEERFKVTYSLSGMTYLLHRLGFSYKKPSVVPGKADSLILDNAGYYKGDKIRDFLKDSSIKLLYLPPYAPNLNLIERLWKFFKKQVLYNQYYETFAQFKEACLDFFRKKNIRKYRKQLNSLLTDNFEIIYV